MELVKGLLHSIGVKASTRQLSELFCLVEQYCHWFQYQTKLQLNLKEWKIIQKELREQHQKGNVIPLKLWTLCSAITQALTLLSTDNETKSNSSRRGEIIYEDVSDVGGASALPEGKDTNEPPPVNGETSDSSESDSEASSVSSQEGKEIKEMTHLFQEWWKSRKEEKNLPLLLLLVLLFSPLRLIGPMWAGNIVGSPFLCLYFMMMTCLLSLGGLSVLHNYFPSRDSKMTM